jgi:hypothetical protein
MSLQNPVWNILIGLLGGLGGAAIGVFGSLHIQRRSELQARRAAGRAVLAEMFTNADRALSAETTLVLHDFSDLAWQQQLPLLAHLLNWGDLKTLVNTYDSAARAFENAKDAMRIEEKSSSQASDPEIARVISWFREVAKEWIAAMRILQSVVLNAEEKRQLDEDIQRLEARLSA